LSFTRSGSCIKVDHEDDGPGSSPGPSPTGSPNATGSPDPTSTPEPTASPSPTPVAGPSNILIHVEVHWANTPTSPDSTNVDLVVYDSGASNIGHTLQSFSSFGDHSGNPLTTSNDISVSFTQGLGATYQGIVAPNCSLAGGGSGSIGPDGTVYATLHVNCN
jgi:hypothetical protein